MKPLIGVSANYVDDDFFFMEQGLGARNQQYSAVAMDYTDAVYDAGGIPVILPPTDDINYLDEILKKLDGIVLTGGNDINPLLFKERPNSKLGRIINMRDNSDMYIANFALKHKIPLLGICRGLQIINTALSGKLIIDIPSEGYLDHTISSNSKHIGVHSVKIEKNSKLFEVYKTEEVMVNSLHHQGIKELGKGLRCIVVSEDGICESIEYDDDQFVLAVQWHPEMMYKEENTHLGIFRLFIEACK